MDARLKNSLKNLGTLGIVALLYYITAKGGLKLASLHVSSTLVWPPSGIALAAVLFFGSRIWPGIFLGAFLINLQTNLSQTPNLWAASWTAAGIALGNTLEAVLGGFLLNRFASGRNTFARTSNIFRFVLYAPVLSAAVSATIGVASITMGGFAGGDRFFPIWITWWLGDAEGILTVTPLLVVWSRLPRFKPARTKGVEALAFLVVLVVIAQISFGGWLPAGVRNYPLTFMQIPILMWAAFRFGQHGSTFSIALLSGFAIWATIHGAGPFAAVLHLNTALLLLQAFMGTISVSTLVLTALIEERNEWESLKRVEEALEKSRVELEKRVEERTAQLKTINEDLLKEITQRKRVEAELARQAKDLIRSNEELEQFAYIASHDLQEPLRMVASYTELLARRYKNKLDKDADDFIGYAVSGVTRMKELISDLLNYSRLNSQKKPFEPVEFGVVFEKAVENLRIAIREKNAVVTRDPLPNVKADFSQLVELFQNLISNGIKFNKSERPSVHVSAKAAGAETVFCIQDNGIGIDPQYHDRIFGIFQRLHNKDEYSGTGIGLTACKKIVERHGGRIWVESAPGKGSTFCFTIPRETNGN